MDNNKNCNYPMVLVFYLDREMMMNQEITKAFAESVNNAIADREANCMAFFLPTDGEERIECISPITTDENNMEHINKIIQDLSNNFDIGKGADDYKNNLKPVGSDKFLNLKNKSEFKLYWDYNGWKGSGYTQKDWNQTLINRVKQISAEIYKSSTGGGANTIIVSPVIFNIIEDLEFFYEIDMTCYNYKVIVDNDMLNSGVLVVKMGEDTSNFENNEIGYIEILNLPEFINK